MYRAVIIFILNNALIVHVHVRTGVYIFSAALGGGPRAKSRQAMVRMCGPVDGHNGVGPPPPPPPPAPHPPLPSFKSGGIVTTDKPLFAWPQRLGTMRNEDGDNL